MVLKKPAPISMSVAKKPPPKKVAPEPKAPAPALAPERIVKQVVKDKALEARVTRLEAAAPPEVIVNIPTRPRITKISISYDPFGAPTALIPSYSE